MIIEKVKVQGGELAPAEVANYVDYLESKYGKIVELTIKLDGEFVDLAFVKEVVPFERIRRITGYLVGTMDNWNNAKSAEEADRVHHTL